MSAPSNSTKIDIRQELLEAQREELLRLDILLRRKQVWWETPKGLLLIVATTVAIAGVLGFKIGQMPPPPIVIQLTQPK